MERQQHQLWAKQPRPPRSQQERMPKAAFSLGKSEWRLALVILGSAWLLMAAIAITAVSGLLSPNASNGSRDPGAATIRDTAKTTQTNNQVRLPLWLFGAIVLTCAAGSMLVAQQANRPPRPRKSMKVKRLAPYAVTTVHQPMPFPAPPPPLPHPPVARPPVVPSFVLHPGPPQPSTAAAPSTVPATLMQLAHQESQAAVSPTDVPATAVSAENKHPLLLDWGEASLADKLHSRKHRSISSLL